MMVLPEPGNIVFIRYHYLLLMSVYSVILEGSYTKQDIILYPNEAAEGSGPSCL